MGWSQESLCFFPRSWFEKFEEGIRNAKHSILLETYIFEDDLVGRQILSELNRAALRGVSVRLIVDGFGSSPWLVSLGKKILDLGFEVRICHPLPGRIVAWSSGFWEPLSRAFQMLTHLNKRDHRKLLIVDGKKAWVGSWNISATHLGLSAKEKRKQFGGEWRDSGCVLCGDSVRELVSVFERSWNSAFSPYRPRIHSVLRRLNPRVWRARVFPWRAVFFTDLPKMRRIVRNEIFYRVATSQNRVWLTTAYFVPVPKLVRALLRASKQGCDVRILIPAHSDVAIIPWLSRFYYRELIAGGVRIFEYQPSVLHAKTLLTDDWIFIGSMNMNFRSFYHDYEIGVALSHPASFHTLMEQFVKDLGSAREVSVVPFQRIPWWQNILSLFLFRVRFWF